LVRFGSRAVSLELSICSPVVLRYQTFDGGSPFAKDGIKHLVATLVSVSARRRWVEERSRFPGCQGYTLGILASEKKVRTRETLGFWEIGGESLPLRRRAVLNSTAILRKG